MTTPERRRWWISPYWRWWPPFPGHGADEWGRHTVFFPTPVGMLVVVTRDCPMTGECAEMAEFECVTDGCHYIAMSPGSPCPSHDPDWITDEEAA